MTDQFKNEDDVVLVALDFIDAFDSNPQAFAPTPPASSCKPPRMHSAQRVRAEIQRLRGSVMHLEAQIADLKLRPPQQAAVYQARSEAQQVLKRSWEDVALRQRAQRQRVAAENAELRALVTSQRELARKLHRLVLRQLQGALNGESDTVASTSSTVEPLAPSVL